MIIDLSGTDIFAFCYHIVESENNPFLFHKRFQLQVYMLHEFSSHTYTIVLLWVFPFRNACGHKYKAAICQKIGGHQLQHLSTQRRCLKVKSYAAFVVVVAFFCGFHGSKRIILLHAKIEEHAKTQQKYVVNYFLR